MDITNKISFPNLKFEEKNFLCPVDHSIHPIKEMRKMIKDHGYYNCDTCELNLQLTFLGNDFLKDHGADSIIVADTYKMKENYYTQLSTLTKMAIFEDDFLPETEKSHFKEYSLYDIDKDIIFMQRRKNKIISYLTTSPFFGTQNRFSRKAFEETAEFYLQEGENLQNNKFGQLYVHPDYRRRGLANNLITCFVRFLI